MKKKKIFFITTCRADYGFIDELLNTASKKLNKFKLYLIISGNHFSKLYGSTYKLIKKYKNITYLKIPLPNTHDQLDSTIKNINFACLKYSNLFKKNKPDLIITFGDRFEMYAFALTAYTFNISQAHIAGGEITKGSLDDGFRHSISKFSNFHFPVSSIYKKRLIKFEINRKNIFNYGNLGFEKIKKTEFLTKKYLSKKLSINFLKYNFIVVFHPETLEIKKTFKNFLNLIKAINTFKNVNFIFTSPGSDYLSSKFISKIIKLKKKNNNIYHYTNLGNKFFLSLLKNSNGIIGNSSSGISEAPLLKVPTLNIGNRQAGRIHFKSIHNSSTEKKDIVKNIKKLMKFKKNKFYNPFGKGDTSIKIVNKIKKLDF